MIRLSLRMLHRPSETLFSIPLRKSLDFSGCGFFQLWQGKPINVMHGGIFVTSSEEILLQARKVYENLDHRAPFQTTKYEFVLASYSAFSNPFLYWIPQRIPFLHLGETIFEPEFAVSPGINLAASLISKMIESTETEKEIRAKNAQWYSTNLEGLSLVEPVPSPNFPYLRYPLMIRNKEIRDQVLNQLMANEQGQPPFILTVK